MADQRETVRQNKPFHSLAPSQKRNSRLHSKARKGRSGDIVSCTDGVEHISVGDRVVYFEKKNNWPGEVIFIGYLDKNNDDIFAVVKTVIIILFILHSFQTLYK